MYVALFDADGVARMLLKAPLGSVTRTAEHYGYDWREIDREIRSADDVPHLSTFPPRD